MRQDSTWTTSPDAAHAAVKKSVERDLANGYISANEAKRLMNKANALRAKGRKKARS